MIGERTFTWFLKKFPTGSESGWKPLINNALKYMDDDKFAETM